MDRDTEAVRQQASDGHVNNDNLVTVIHRQDTLLREPGMPVARTELGGGYFVGKNGSDCEIVTDSHVVADLKSAPFKDGKDIELDTSKPGTTSVILPDGKRLSAQILSDDPTHDKAVLKVSAADAGDVCRAEQFASALPNIGDHATSSGFGGGVFGQHDHVLIGSGTPAGLSDLVDFSKEGAKIDKDMPLMIFEGEVNRGDSGGVMRNAEHQIFGRVIAAAPVVADDGTVHNLTFVSPDFLSH